MNSSADTVASRPDDSALRRVLYEERIRMLFSHTASMCWLSGTFAFVLAYVLRHSVNPSHLLIWLIIKTATMMPRAVQLLVYQRSADPGAPSWRKGLIALLALDGAAWGLGCAWLMPADDLTVTAVIVASLVGSCAVSSVVLEADFLSHLAFTVPLMAPTSISLLLKHDAFSIYGGAGTLTLMVVMLYEGRRSEQRFIELVTLRHATQLIAEERADALARAEQSSAFKSRFLAQISHELRTPLHGILGLSRMVRDRETDLQSKEQLKLLERSGRHLLGVINDVLDLSKIEAGHLKIAPQVFDVSKLIDDVVALSAISASRKGLELRTENKLGRPWAVHGDPARVRQILLNLVGNAIKFTERGHVRVSVSALKDSPSMVCIGVKDTGIGMTPGDQACIFEAFKQVGSGNNTRMPGTGLGLTISRELARAMGGDITCTSALGQGSEFLVSLILPPSTDPLPAQQVAQSTDDQAQAPRTLHGHILLAEDNPVNALVAQAHLSELGLQVSTVADGQAAVDFVREHRPDLVLMDCQMPVLDGFDATREIRRNEAQSRSSPLPIIALTANAMDSDRERCLAAGMDDHLPKPFDQAELKSLLQRYLPVVIKPQTSGQARLPVSDFTDTDSGPVTV